MSYRKEICERDNATIETTGKWNYTGDTIMCPECEIWCPYWKLKKSCNLSKVAYLFDNYATIAFSVAMSIWG